MGLFLVALNLLFLVVPVVVLVGLALVVLVVGLLLVPSKLCFDALSSPSETSAPDRVFKLRQVQLFSYRLIHSVALALLSRTVSTRARKLPVALCYG